MTATNYGDRSSELMAEIAEYAPYARNLPDEEE